VFDGAKYCHSLAAVSTDGTVRRGIIPIGTPDLKATAAQLSTPRQKSMTHCDVVDFPVQRQTIESMLGLSQVKVSYHLISWRKSWR
jgi:hypothetical protein